MRSLALAALAVVLSGCFHLSSLLTVRPDGSATLRDEVTLSGFALMALQNAAEAGGDEPREMFEREAFEARAEALGEGVQLVSFEPAEDGYVAVYAVPDVRRLRYTTPDVPGDEGDGESRSMGERLDLSFAFDEADPATLRIVVPKPEADKPEAPTPDADGMVKTEEAVDPADQARMLGMLREFFADARMTVSVAVEGDVVETNAAHVDGSTVTVFDLPFAAVFEVLEDHPELMTGERPDPDAAYEMLQGAEGVRMERPGTVRVRFR